MRVAVLGGTQFIGAATVEHLVAAGHDVSVMHRGRTERDDLPDVAHVHLDRLDGAALSDALDDLAADAVVDTCAYTAADADVAVSAIGDVPAVVLSSMDTYRAFGSVHAGTVTDAVPLDEDSPVRPERYPYRGRDIAGMNTHDYEKLDVEDRYLAAGATVLRLPMVYGERDDQRREEFVLRRVRAGRPRMPFGAGTWLWTKGWVRDVAAAIGAAVERHPGPLILNVGEARTWSMEQWALEIAHAAGAELELVRMPEDALPADLRITGAIAQHLLVDSSLARQRLRWTDTDPDVALRASVQWHLAHPPAADDDFAADDAALASAH